MAAGILKSANAIMLRFPLRSDTPEMRRLSLKLELEYLLFMENVNRSKVEVLVRCGTIETVVSC